MAEFALIGKSLVYAKAVGSSSANSATSPELLDDGAIGIYAVDPTDKGYKLVVTGAASTGQVSVTGLKAKDITIFQGFGNGKNVFQSEVHQLRGFKEYVKSAYAAGVAQVIDIGSNGTDGTLGVPSLIASGFSDASIRIKEESDGVDYNNWVFIDGGRILPSDDDDSIADKLVAAVNNHPVASTLFTATKSTQSTNYGVKLTAKIAGKNYTVAIGGVIEMAPVRYTTYGRPATGSADQVRSREALDHIYRGNFYTGGGLAYSKFNITSQVAVNGQYIEYWLRSVNETKDKTGQKATTDHEVSTWLYIPTGADVVTNLDAILAAVAALSSGPQGPQGAQGAQGA